MENKIDAPLTTELLFSLGRNEDVHIERFGLLIRFDRFTWGWRWGNRARVFLDRIDRVLFDLPPFLQRYCRTVMVRYRKLLL